MGSECFRYGDILVFSIAFFTVILIYAFATSLNATWEACYSSYNNKWLYVFSYATLPGGSTCSLLLKLRLFEFYYVRRGFINTEIKCIKLFEEVP